MPEEPTDPGTTPPEPSGAVAPTPPEPPPVVVPSTPVVPVKATAPTKAAPKKEEKPKEETPLEHVQRIIREHDGQVSNIPYNHPTFWDAKAKL